MSRIQHLSQQIDALLEELHELERMEGELSKIAKSTGREVSELVVLVKESNEIQVAMRQKLQAAVLQQILSVVIRSDVDRTFTLGPKELDTLLVAFRRFPGVELDFPEFSETIRADRYDKPCQQLVHLLSSKSEIEKSSLETEIWFSVDQVSGHPCL